MQNTALKYHDSTEGVHISATPLLATVTIQESQSRSQLSEECIYRALKHQGIQHGIHPKQIKSIIRQQLYNKAIPVAFHTPAQEGKQGWIDEKIDLSKSCKPKELNDGSIDYKNIDRFMTIQAGEVIAEIHHPKPGRNGVNIFGQPIFPQSMEHWEPKIGKNIGLTENQLIAEKSGIIYKSNNTIHIDTKLTIKGSVDYSTGHIKFIGDILIHGDVMPGFRVEAQGDIHIKGNVESALITSTHGNITIEGGVNGKSPSFLKAHKNINLSYAQGAHIDAGIGVTFQNYLLNCQTLARRDIKSIKNNAFISGGCTSAQSKIWVNQIGNKAENHTAIYLHSFDSENLLKEIEVEKEHLKKLEQQLTEVTQQIKSLKSHLHQNLINREDLKKLLLEEIERYQSTLEQKNQSQLNLTNLHHQLKNEYNKPRSLTVLKCIYPKTVIHHTLGKKIFREQSSSIYLETNKGTLKEEDVF